MTHRKKGNEHVFAARDGMTHRKKGNEHVFAAHKVDDNLMLFLRQMLITQRTQSA